MQSSALPRSEYGQIDKNSIRALLERIKVLEGRQQKGPYNPQRQGAITRTNERLATLMITKNNTTPVNLDFHNSNITEHAFSKAASAAGWSVVKKGWPDYLCWKLARDGTRTVVFVEVKRERQDLTAEQSLVMSILANLGLKCYRWSPVSGFRSLKAVAAREAKRRKN